MVDKFITRKTIKDRRAFMSIEQVTELSAKICDRVLSLPAYAQAEEICLYIPKGNEVDTMPIVRDALRAGKMVSAPRVSGKDMDFYQFDRIEELQPGAFGILEPQGAIRANTKEALLIMPGVAFDEQKNRIGYGGGYYDRYLAKHSFFYAVALAFELQVVKELSAEAFDKKPDVIVTEDRTI